MNLNISLRTNQDTNIFKFLSDVPSNSLLFVNTYIWNESKSGDENKGLPLLSLHSVFMDFLNDSVET